MQYFVRMATMEGETSRGINRVVAAQLWCGLHAIRWVAIVFMANSSP